MLGTVDYRYSHSLTFQVGYRNLHLDWNGSMLKVNFTLSEPFLGMTYQF